MYMYIIYTLYYMSIFFKYMVSFFWDAHGCTNTTHDQPRSWCQNGSNGSNTQHTTNYQLVLDSS